MVFQLLSHNDLVGQHRDLAVYIYIYTVLRVFFCRQNDCELLVWYENYLYERYLGQALKISVNISTATL